MQVNGLQCNALTYKTHHNSSVYPDFYIFTLSFPLCVPEAEVHGSEELAGHARKLDLFWSGVRPILDSGPPESKLHDVVQLSYTAPSLCPPVHTQDTEAEVSWASLFSLKPVVCVHIVSVGMFLNILKVLLCRLMFANQSVSHSL